RTVFRTSAGREAQRNMLQQRLRKCGSQAGAMIDVVVINMKRSAERRAGISNRLDTLGVAFRIFEAVDGDSLSPVQRDQIAPPFLWRSIGKRKAVAGEIGCALSHLNAIRAHSDLEFFCVLEDDAVPSTGI